MYTYNSVENFCTTLPSYVVDLLKNEAKNQNKTASEVLQIILEKHYGVVGWREELNKRVYEGLIRRIHTSNKSNIVYHDIEDSNLRKISINMDFPYKMELSTEIERVQYKVLFILYTSAKNTRKTFSDFYNYHLDILKNRDMYIEDYARFACIGYKKSIQTNDVNSVYESGTFSEKIVEDLLFLRSLILRYKWNKK